MDELTFFKIAEWGFPATLCFYLIFRLNSTLADLAKAIEQSSLCNHDIKTSLEEIKTLLHKLKE